jgi:hypothetical protein
MLKDKKMTSLKDKLYSEQVEKTPEPKVAKKEDLKPSTNKSKKK